MYNIWDFGVTIVYSQIVHHLFIRLGIISLLQVRKTRLREVQTGNTNVWWAVLASGLRGSWCSNLSWPDPKCISSHHIRKCSGRMGFFVLWNQLLLQASVGQPHCSVGPGRGKSWVEQNGSVSSSWGKTPLTVNSVCTDQSEQKRIVPSVDKTILPDFKASQLRREPPVPGTEEMEMEARALLPALGSLGAERHTATACHPSWLLFESEALHNPTPSLLLSPNIPKAQFLFEVDVLLFTRPAAVAQRD